GQVLHLHRGGRPEVRPREDAAVPGGARAFRGRGRGAVMRTRGPLTPLGLGLVLFAAASGCRPDMHDQPKYKPLPRSDFFAAHRASRRLLPGTIARGQLKDDSPFNTGKSGGQFVDSLPVELTAELLERGRTRYESFCAPCHGRVGRGDGMVVKRGFKAPNSY